MPSVRLSRTFDALAVAACIGLDAWLLLEVLHGLRSSTTSWLLIGLAALIAYLAADFISGFVHFLGDTFGSPETPVLGRTFIGPFRAHHQSPHEICTHGFLETNGNNAFVTLFALAPTILFVPVAHGGVPLVFGVFVMVFATFTFLTNQIHKWVHMPVAPRLVRAMQKARILLGPERHLRHHRPPYDGNYCITSGWLNALLDRTAFFPRTERLVRAVAARILSFRSRAFHARGSRASR